MMPGLPSQIKFLVAQGKPLSSTTPHAGGWRSAGDNRVEWCSWLTEVMLRRCA